MSRTSTTKNSGSAKRQASGVLVSILAFVGVFTKQATRLSGKLLIKAKPRESSNIDIPKPKPKTKQPLTNITHKTLPFIHNSGKKQEEGEEWGDGGVWQRAILMGDKCQPLDFSGVIYYDSSGKQLQEIPARSPRASPMPGYMTRNKEQQSL